MGGYSAENFKTKGWLHRRKYQQLLEGDKQSLSVEGDKLSQWTLCCCSRGVRRNVKLKFGVKYEEEPGSSREGKNKVDAAAE